MLLRSCGSLPIGSGRLHRLKEGVRPVGVEELVGPHERDQIFRVREIDDIVGITGKHVDGLGALAADFKFQNLLRSQLPLLDQPVAGDHDEKLPLAVASSDGR